MIRLIALAFSLAATLALAAEPPSANPVEGSAVKGVVQEFVDVDSYTYLRIKTARGEIWAAVDKAAVRQGTTVMIENATVMRDFHSKTLNRTFPTIVFGNLAGARGSPHGTGNEMAVAHANLAKATDTADIRVDKAVGANARTVGEIVGKSAELKDKPVLVRGKVVKYNPGIMGKNWLHLRDGSGSATDGSNDILVTTNDAAKLGDIVTVKGIVHTDKDFGAGYAYKVLIEEATVQP